MFYKLTVSVVCLVTIVCTAVFPAQACTLYAASGSAVQDGGTLIAKVRDEKPENQYGYMVKSADGSYGYYGLFTREDGYGLRGGINEKGLVAVSSTVETIAKSVRLAEPKHPGGVLRELLTHCATVDEALRVSPEVWTSPQNIMIADKNEVAYIEIGIGGAYSITREANGTLCHTNHYVNKDMLDNNERAAKESTLTRYERITELLSSQKQFAMNDFIRFSTDQNAGVHNSIWRLGEGGSVQSLAAFIVRIPAEGAPEVYLKIREKPEQKGQEKIYRFQMSAQNASGRK